MYILYQFYLFSLVTRWGGCYGGKYAYQRVVALVMTCQQIEPFLCKISLGISWSAVCLSMSGTCPSSYPFPVRVTIC